MPGLQETPSSSFNSFNLFVISSLWSGLWSRRRRIMPYRPLVGFGNRSQFCCHLDETRPSPSLPRPITVHGRSQVFSTTMLQPFDYMDCYPMKILVTRTAQFIGSHLAARLLVRED